MGNVRFAPEIIAFVAIFLGIMIFLKMLEQVLKDVVKSAKLGGIDKVIGLVFGIVEGLIITTLLLFVMSVQPLFDVDSFIRDSLFAEILLPLIQIPLERGREAINAAVLIRDKFPAADFMLADLAFAASRPAGVFPPEISGAFPA